MLKPPTHLSEFLVFRPADGLSFEVFVFPVPIDPILSGYADGHPIDVAIEPDIKSYLFEDMDSIDLREAFGGWLATLNLADVEKCLNICSAWRLTHIRPPDRAYPPQYQGHPVRLEAWRRTPTLITREKKRGDPFDPLQQFMDSAFSSDGYPK